jgi:S-methylmethionine-dependent homocysteine/selenocysteine methylase
MNNSKDTFPRINGDLFLTDAGIETYIMYKKGFELPYFSLFHLLTDPKATQEITAYCRSLIDVALRHKVGMILCGIHYRASRDWGELLGYTPSSLADINRKGVELLRSLKREYETDDSPMVVSACIGPRGDAYQLNKTMNVDEAEDYHSEQIATLKSAGADLVTALTLNSTVEAIGLARAAKAIDMPCVMSFTLDQVGRLKTGQSLKEAIQETDTATEKSIAYYMINCTHPVDFQPALEPGDWRLRLNGIRPNASSLEKGVLCQLGHLEEGDPVELGQQMGAIAEDMPHMSVWGGCCGTDAAHMDEICRNVLAARKLVDAA